jgi:DNA repair protein RecN (Recombination protein N)
MLTHLFIRDLAIVDRAELALDGGLTVLTGETGAGKSVLIDALALVLGQRADSEVIRHGCDQAEIMAAFELESRHDAAHWLTANELFEDGECVLRRVIYRDRATKGFINGRPVPMQMLRELGDHLVDIHGQHEHQSLLKRDVQRQILDDFAGIGGQVDELADLFRELKSEETRLTNLSREAADRESRIDVLSYQIRELEALNLAAEELGDMEQEHARLAHASELVDGVQSVANVLYDADNGSASQILSQAMTRLGNLVEFDTALAQTADLLTEAAIRLDEAAGQLHHYLDRLEADPQRLEWLEDRMGTITDLARKHQVSPDALPVLLENLRAELADLEDSELNSGRLSERIEQLRGQYQAAAVQVSAARQAAAEDLSGKVSDQMQELGLAGGRFEVRVVRGPLEESKSHGLDHIEFQVSANPGQPLKPLARVASGGELSRISLALQVVTAAIGRIPTLIFDEVDVGIGGRVAEIVGQKLRARGQSRQVICITHLAQVAAQGSRHLQISKRGRTEVRVAIAALTQAERINEIARMIGGVTITDQTVAHAEDMLARAAS